MRVVSIAWEHKALFGKSSGLLRRGMRLTQDLVGIKSVPECCPSSNKLSKTNLSILTWFVYLIEYMANAGTEGRVTRLSAMVISDGRAIVPGMPSAILRTTAIGL